MVWSKLKKVATVGIVAIICAAGLGTAIYKIYFPTTAAAVLSGALNQPKPQSGNWQYPSVEVGKALMRFGSNRVAALPTLKRAIHGSNPEARYQAIAAMGFLLTPAKPQFGLLGDPATNAIPVLREILYANNDASPFALASLRNSLEAKDILPLVDLFLKNHDIYPAQTQKSLDRADANQRLQRYIPEAIAEIFARDPEGASTYLSSVENLLDRSDSNVRFGAACALAKYDGVANSKISTALTAGLQGQDDQSHPYTIMEGLNHLMAIETLQHIGSDAKPMVPELLGYAKSTQNKFMGELALRAAGHIDPSLCASMPEVDAAVKNAPNARNQPQ